METKTFKIATRNQTVKTLCVIATYLTLEDQEYLYEHKPVSPSVVLTELDEMRCRVATQYNPYCWLEDDRSIKNFLLCDVHEYLESNWENLETETTIAINPVSK